MSEVTIRMKRILNYSDLEAGRLMMEKLNYKSGRLVCRTLANEHNKQIIYFVNVLKLLDAGGLLIPRSLGAKGTHIEIPEEKEMELREIFK